jgi:tellurite resistance protein TerC
MGTPFLWITFNLFILVAIVLDLRVFHRRAHRISVREAGLASAGWIGVSVLFGLGVLRFYGQQPALEYFTGYLIEKALSVDNLFLFLVIFRAFAVDDRVQHRLLEWGVLGALIMRGVMIALGAELIEHFSWVLYLLGGFLIYAGLRMLFARKLEVHPEQNKLFRFARKHLRVTQDYQGEKFFVRHAGKLCATPLFLVLLVVEITDVTLAVDSIPAVFGITRDPFIVFTSNVLAILGLRALYFLLAGVIDRLQYLDEGLAFVLVFIGGKMIGEPWIHIPVSVSLGVVGGVLLIALLASLLIPARKKISAIEALASSNPAERRAGAEEIYRVGRAPADAIVSAWWGDSELSALLLGPNPVVTVGLAVPRESFDLIHAANGSPRLSEVPPDQDAEEFELHFPHGVLLDILTTREPGGSGAIARYLTKFGEGVQQVEFRCTNVDRATEILKSKFSIAPIYPLTRAGADGTGVNFFLVTTSNGGKALIELYELPKPPDSARNVQQ